MSNDGLQVFSVPVEGHGAAYVYAEDRESALTEVRSAAQSVRLGNDYLSLETVVDVTDPGNIRETTPDEARNQIINDPRPQETRVDIPSVPSWQQLRSAREDLGFTTAEVAEEMGKTRSTVSTWENQHTGKLTDARRYKSALLSLRGRDR